MGNTMMLWLAAAALLQSSASATPPDPKAMSRAEIKTHNAKLDPNDPYYIRCKRSAETGSLVKKIYSCRTNQEWGMAWDTGNRNARETINAFVSAGGNVSN